MQEFKMPTIDEIRNHPNPNYLEKNEIQRTLKDILDREEPHVESLVEDWVKKGVKNLYLVGCGGSRSIMEPGKYIMDRFSNLTTERYSAYEFVTRKPRAVGKGSIVVLASHSGETESVIEAAKFAKNMGAWTLGFTGKETSTLADSVDHCLTYDSPAANLSKLLMVYLVCTHLIIKLGDLEAGRDIMENLKKLPDTLMKIKEDFREKGLELAKEFKDTQMYYVVGSGLLAGLAYQFCICTLMEMQWLHAAPIHGSEFPHGPFEIVSPEVTMIFLLGTDESRMVTERALKFAQRYGAKTIVFDTIEEDVHPMLTPFALGVMLQWFAYGLSIEREHPLAVRRYMGKVAY